MSWETLRPVLLELSSREPRPLLRYPDPRVSGERRQPYRIHLAAWALAVARDLHARFGDEVVLTVGSFGYPGRTRVDALGRRRSGPDRPDGPERLELADPSVILVELRHALVVRSGHDATGEVVIANRSPDVLEFQRPTATVADPETGVTVGGHGLVARNPVGRLPFRLASGRSGAVHFTVGTASYHPDLGYAVPRGSWALRVLVPLTDGRTLRAPLLPIEIR